jgi:carbamoyl-phosphate synthase large subunit
VNLPLPRPPEPGQTLKIFCSVHNTDKTVLPEIARSLHDMGFTLVATRGTRLSLQDQGIPAEFVFKINEGRPNVYDLLVNGDICLVINTPLLEESKWDDLKLRRTAVEYAIPYVTTLSAARAAVEGIRSYLSPAPPVKSLQEYHEALEKMRKRR